MRIHADKKLLLLKKLRKQGYSINELVKKLVIPKTTVWYHVHNIQLLPEQIAAIKTRQGGSKSRKDKNMEIAKKLAQQLLQSRHRELAIVLAMLYWGEGSKKVCEFINSDGNMIKLYIHILRNVLSIPDDKIQPTMRIFSGMNENECLNYWSEATSIPKHQFRVRWNDGSTSRGKTPYGMCRITIRKGQNSLKLIHSIIELFFAKTHFVASSVK